MFQNPEKCNFTEIVVLLTIPDCPLLNPMRSEYYQQLPFPLYRQGGPGEPSQMMNMLTRISCCPGQLHF